MKKRCDACKKQHKRTVTDGYLTICKDCLPKNKIYGECNFCGEKSIMVMPVPVIFRATTQRIASFFLMMGCPSCKLKETEKNEEESGDIKETLNRVLLRDIGYWLCRRY